jgi:starvation-inducible DNA-binding protein
MYLREKKMMLDLKGRELMHSAAQPSENTTGTFTIISDLKREGVAQIVESLNLLLADVFALYLKTKSFHWHISGPHFRDYHLLLDEQAAQIFAMTDDIAERTRKIGGITIRSISDISRHQRLRDNNDTSLSATDMLAELRSDNKQVTSFLRLTHEVASGNDDVATTSLIENWIDESERRTWFLSAALGKS